jgi:hypothetical protein
MLSITSVYVRTPQGLISAFDTAFALPARLKELLRAVDGNTSVSALFHQFASWPDVMDLLEQLHSAGLIEDKNANNSEAAWTNPRGWPATVPVGLDFGKCTPSSEMLKPR